MQTQQRQKEKQSFHTSAADAAQAASAFRLLHFHEHKGAAECTRGGRSRSQERQADDAGGVRSLLGKIESSDKRRESFFEVHHVHGMR